MNQYLTQELAVALVGLIVHQIRYQAPATVERCIRDVAIHAHLPVLATAAIVAGYEWPPRPVPPESVNDLTTLLNQMAYQIEQWLSEVPLEVFLQPVELRWGPFSTGAEALANSLVPGLVHAGVIRGIRAISGFPTPPERP